MKNLVNVVHPHTYRTVEDDGLDERVVDFLGSIWILEQKF